MKRKILKGFLVVVCQLILLTGVGFARELDEDAFIPKPFNEVNQWVKEFKGKIEDDKYLEEIEEVYKEAYELEKETKYFKADKKWREVISLTDDIYETLEDYFEENYKNNDEEEEFFETLDEFEDEVVGYINQRDYMYGGFPSFEEAYELELEDFVNLISKDKREAFKELLEEKYMEMEAEWKKVTYLIKYKDYNAANKEKYLEYKKARSKFDEKKREIAALIKATYDKKGKQYLVFTKNGVYDVRSVYLYPKKLNRFLREEEVLDVISEKDIEKIKKLSKEASEAEKDVEKDDLLDEIEEMFLDYYPSNGKKYYKGENNRNAQKINELYDEIEEDD